MAHFQFLKLFRLDENLEDYLESYDYILKIKGFENIEHLFDHSFNTLITLENRHFEDTQRNSPCFERIVYNLEAIKRKLAGLTEYQQEHKDWLSSRHEIKLNTMIVGLNFLSLKYDQDDNQRLRYLRKFIEHMKSPEKDTIKRMKTLPFEAETIVGDML